MASGGWQVFLFLFIVGVVCGAFNQMNLWQYHAPQTNYNVTMDNLNAAEEATTQGSPLSIFVVYQWVAAFVTVIFSGIVAVFSIGALLYGLGFPTGIIGAALITMIQAPATLIAFMWLYELWTGRQA